MLMSFLSKLGLCFKIGLHFRKKINVKQFTFCLTIEIHVGDLNLSLCQTVLIEIFRLYYLTILTIYMGEKWANLSYLDIPVF